MIWEHSDNNQGKFRGHSRNNEENLIRALPAGLSSGTFREHSGNIQGTVREQSANSQGNIEKRTTCSGFDKFPHGAWPVSVSHRTTPNEYTSAVSSYLQRGATHL
jgi:hypothetical protein